MQNPAISNRNNKFIFNQTAYVSLRLLQSEETEAREVKQLAYSRSGNKSILGRPGNGPKICLTKVCAFPSGPHL